MNGARGTRDIEHARSGIARVDCNAARVAGESTVSASDQGKAARVAASELGNERVSIVQSFNRSSDSLVRFVPLVKVRYEFLGQVIEFFVR